MEVTAQRIIDAAIIIFNDDLSAALEVVANKAGVTRRTLHRYFADRSHLLEACTSEMMTSCQAAMTAAYNSSDLPLRQLEMMLYAGIDCNYKYAFLTKLQQRTTLPPLLMNPADEYDSIKHKWYALIEQLQRQQLIDQRLTLSWIFTLFGGMINTTIAALQSGEVAPKDIKKFAWYSFSHSIGINSATSH